MQESSVPAGGRETRAGHVALVGRPNVGKSTLLNALIGEKLSIVTPRAQTTREPVTGILTTGGVQAIFVDTPGVLEPTYALQRVMLEAALRTVAGADVVLLVLDATETEELPEGEAQAAVTRRASDVFVAINKIDAAPVESVQKLEEWSGAALGKRAYAVSALAGSGVDALRGALLSALPSNPFFYPEDELAVQPVRFFAAELVRETIFEEYGQEIPYATVVRIEEYREAADPVYIRATVYVERESQKPIIIGRGGAGIRRLGERAREKIESFLGTRVYLDLWVKALPGWRKKPAALRYLGYAVPAEGAGAKGAKARDRD